MAKARFSFKITILVLFAVLTLGLSATVIYVNYVRNSRAVLEAAEDLLAQVSANVVSTTARLIEPLLTLAETVVLVREADASADPAKHGLAPLLFTALDRYPQIASAYVGNARGDFYRIAAMEGDREAARKFLEAPHASMFAVQSIRKDDTTGARDAAWQFLGADKAVLGSRRERETGYDPRTRPWYAAAQDSAGTIVTDYYAFASVPSVGLTVARRRGDAAGTVFAADLTLASVSRYLAGMRDTALGMGRRGEIAVVHADGRLLAHSDRAAYERLLDAAAEPRVPVLDKVGSEVLGRVVARYRESGVPRLRVEDNKGEPWIAHVAALPPAFGSGTFLAIAAPLEEFLGPLAQSARQTATISFLVVVVFLPFVYGIASAAARPLAHLTEEVSALRHFEFGQTPPVESSIAEIQDLGDALATSKVMIGAFAKYVPKSLVQQMMERGVEPRIAGERRMVTVFFSDVRDFTTMSEELPPEELMRFTSEYLEGLVNIILENRGTVDKFVGDQIMAYWNAPVPNPDHVADGCLAILRCRDWSNRKNAEWEAAGRPILYTRFALHLGDAIVGNVGSSDRMDYTVVGNTINLGSRLEGLNKVYGTQIVVSEPVAEKLGSNRFVLRPIDKVLPKGAVFPLGLYELRGAHPDSPDAPADVKASRNDLRLCARWAEVYDLYLARDWSGGLLRALEDYAAEFPHDPVAALYLERVTRFILEPPEPDWDGVVRYSEK